MSAAEPPKVQVGESREKHVHEAVVTEAPKPAMINPEIQSPKDDYKLTSLDKFEEMLGSKESATTSVATPPEIKTSVPQTEIDSDVLINAWAEFLDQLKKQGKMSLHSVMSQTSPEFSDLSTLRITVENQLVHDQMQTIRTDLTSFLSKKLSVEGLVLEVEVKKGKADEKEKPAYTASEKFSKMAEQNPELEQMRDKLDLELEH